MSSSSVSEDCYCTSTRWPETISGFCILRTRVKTGSFYLVDWSVRHPQRGIAVVYSDSGIPIDGDPERETAYWVIETANGFRWNIVRTVQRGQDANFDPATIAWQDEWDAQNDRWKLVVDDDRISVHRSDDGVEQHNVLTLPSGIVWTVEPTEGYK